MTLLLLFASVEFVKALPTLESSPELEARDGSVTVWNAPRDPTQCHELDVDDVQSCEFRSVFFLTPSSYIYSTRVFKVGRVCSYEVGRRRMDYVD